MKHVILKLQQLTSFILCWPDFKQFDLLEEIGSCTPKTNRMLYVNFISFFKTVKQDKVEKNWFMLYVLKIYDVFKIVNINW